MKKEVFLAISIGFALGLLITFGIWTANKSLKPPTPSDTSITASSTVSPTPSGPTPTSVVTSASGEISLSVNSLTDEMLASATTLPINGTSASGATIIVTGEKTQTIVTADAQGVFTTSTELEGGYNIIGITALDESGKKASLEFTVTYTTSKI